MCRILFGLIVFACLFPLTSSQAEVVVMLDDTVLTNIVVKGESEELVYIEHSGDVHSYKWELFPKDFRKKYQPGYTEALKAAEAAAKNAASGDNAPWEDSATAQSADPFGNEGNVLNNTQTIENGTSADNESEASTDFFAQLLNKLKNLDPSMKRSALIGLGILAFVIFYIFR